MKIQSAYSKHPFDVLSMLATEIEHKFEMGRALDIDPDLLNEIIRMCLQGRKETRGRQNQALLLETENQCYAAHVDYKTSQTRSSYFMRLREIARLIREMERE